MGFGCKAWYWNVSSCQWAHWEDTELFQAEIIFRCSNHVAEIKKYIDFSDTMSITEAQWLNLKAKDTVSIPVKRAKKNNLSRLLIFLSVEFILHGHCKKEWWICLFEIFHGEGRILITLQKRKQCIQDDFQFCSFCTASHLVLILQSVKPITNQSFTVGSIWSGFVKFCLSPNNWAGSYWAVIVPQKHIMALLTSCLSGEWENENVFTQHRLFQMEVPVGYGASLRRIVLGLQKWMS